MREKKIKAITWIVGGLVPLALGACGPSDKQRAEQAEKTRIECLDKICQGDVEPNRDVTREVALKLNGQWYIAPKTYFATDGRGAFYWPAKIAAYAPGDLPPGVKGRDFYDVAIEIFLGTPRTPISDKNMYQTLLALDDKGLVQEKRTLRPGLQLWRTRQEGQLPESWYVATALQEPNGDPPTIACRGDDPIYYRCNTGFMWQPDVAANMRFRAMHGPDWPEIYLETTRILKLLRKA